MSDLSKIVIVLLTLHAWCWLYALVLNHKAVHDWYYPDRLWVTVVVGDGWIIIACALLERWGVDLNTGLLTLACVAAGIPIVIWQLIQHGQNEGARHLIQNGDDDHAHDARRGRNS